MTALRLLLVFTAGITFGAESTTSVEPPNTTSPDGRFALRIVDGKDGVTDAQIVEGSRVVANLPDRAVLYEKESIRLVWAADSRGVAVNYAASGRFETTALFRWKDDHFDAIPLPDAEFYKRIVEPARLRELKAAGKPADTALHRIWDAWKAAKWVDDSAVEIHGESVASYAVGNDTVDISVGMRAVVRFDKDGKPALTDVREVPAMD